MLQHSLSAIADYFSHCYTYTCCPAISDCENDCNSGTAVFYHL